MKILFIADGWIIYWYIKTRVILQLSLLQISVTIKLEAINAILVVSRSETSQGERTHFWRFPYQRPTLTVLRFMPCQYTNTNLNLNIYRAVSYASNNIQYPMFCCSPGSAHSLINDRWASLHIYGLPSHQTTDVMHSAPAMRNSGEK